MPTDPNRVKEIFLEAAEQPDEAARAAYLDQTCGGDAGLRDRVEALLRSHDPAGTFLGTPAAVVPDPNRDDTLAVDPTPKPRPVPDEEADGLNFLSPSTRPDSLGRLGHYEMLQVLGKGGFGIVFRAFDETLQRVVAIKVMAPQIATLSPARKRFLREARSSAQVRHENVVQVYEVGEQPLPFLAMEFIPGETLQQKLDRCGPLEVPEVLRIGRQIAEGLAAAHACDLIHRDIKPGNILLEGGAQKAKITDFGLARAADDASISQSGIIAGTPMFMSPEQALGHKIDQRADLFSLGSVLYQMVSGRPPFRAPSALAVLKRVAEESPRPIPEIIPETPAWLCGIITKLHAKNPDDRFQSAREVADLLADCEAQLKANSKLKDFSRIPRGQPTPSTSGQWKRAATLVPMLAGMVVVAIVVTLKWPHRQPDPAPTSIANVDATKDTATPTTDPDRRAAEYVLSHYGMVKVNEQEQDIKARADLPREPFRLTSVDFGFNMEFSDDGLASFKGCKNLVHLALNGIQPPWSATYTDEGLAYFKDCKNLTSLYLNSFGVTDAGLLPFKECKNLTILSLGGTRITDAGLARIRGFNNLTHLYLGDTRVTDAGLALIAGLDKLTDLNLGWTQVTAQGVKGLAKVLPRCKITWDGGVIEPKAATPPTFTNSIGMEFVIVPKGKSWLGGGKGKLGDREVEIPADFYLGKYEVTQEEWEKVMGRNPSAFSRKGGGKDAVKDVADTDLKRFPVESVSWDQCQLFVAKLNRLENEPGWDYRLPNEEEWEYACRGGPMPDKRDSAFDFYFAKPTNTLLPAQANFNNGLQRPAKVGSYEPNALGLYDMHGNVEEWCDDPHWVSRGGDFQRAASDCRAESGSGAIDGIGNRGLGLRLVRVRFGTPSPEAHTSPPPVAPFTDADVQRIAALPAEQQVEEVRKELKRRNPGFDGKVETKIEGGVVTEFKIVTDKVTDIAPIRVFNALRVLECGGTWTNGASGLLADLTPLGGMAALTHLNLMQTKVTDAGIAYLKSCKDLKYLNLNNTRVTDKGLAHLKDCQSLAILDMSATKVTDEGLANLKDCRALTHLLLGGTKVSDAGLANFKGMPLILLWIDNTRVTDLTPLQGMPLEEIRLTPKNITQGLDILRDMKSLKTIGIGWQNDKAWPAAEFWERYGKGEFKK